MKIVHTSDWHIGRRFDREPLEADQRAFLRWLAQEVEARGVDLVIVAGDVYDRSLPSEEAVALLDQGLDELRSAGATVAMIPGNHDSARRLGFGARRQALGGVHVFAGVGPPEPWVYRAGEDEVAIVAVPFLDPLAVGPPRAAPDGAVRARTHENVLLDALAAAWEGVVRLGNAHPATVGGVRVAPGVDGRRDARDARAARMPIVAVAHATVAGASPSDSEKALAVGGADAVAASVFDGFDYVALGHFHRPQCIDGSDRIAYSGSPLPYSFSEAHQKSVRLLEVCEGSVQSVEQLAIPVGRPVVTLEGPLDRLLTDPEYDRYEDHWVAGRLTDDVTQVQAMDRLRQRFPHAVSVRYARAGVSGGAVGGAGSGYGPSIAAGLAAPGEARPVDEVVFAFLAEVSGAPPDGWAKELVLEAVELAQRGPEWQRAGVG